MNRDPILFRVDGTTATGLERLARCLTLAAALQRRRRPTYFLSQLEPASLALAIKRAGNDWLEPDGTAGSVDDVEETIQEVRRELDPVSEEPGVWGRPAAKVEPRPPDRKAVMQVAQKFAADF